MPPLPPLRNLILVLLSVAFSAKISVCATNKHFQNCSIPRTRGGYSMTFPFSILDQQPSYCGFPGFELACINNTPILNVSGNDYVVHDIFYQNQSLRISNSAVLNNSTFSCTPVLNFHRLSSKLIRTSPPLSFSSTTAIFLSMRITFLGQGLLVLEKKAKTVLFWRYMEMMKMGKRWRRHLSASGKGASGGRVERAEGER
ncbi:hypothetical protein NL676_037877 [Syzygium grande]|nr:hypothetical protein NL676_037877 [Syzygium grande]